MILVDERIGRSSAIGKEVLGNEKKSLLVSPSALASFEGSHVFFLLLFSLLSTGLYIFPFFRVRDVFLGQLTRRSNKGGSDRKRTSNCLALLAARLIHLTCTLSPFPSHPIIDDLLCRLLNYSLTCFTRFVYWLISFVSLERAYTSVFLNKQWLKQAHIARRLMIFTFVVICLSAVDELLFLKSFSSREAGSGSMCIIAYPAETRSMWIRIHQVVSVVNLLLPLLINICCTSTIIGIVIQIKMNIRKAGNEGRLDDDEMRRGRNLFRGVLNENKEIITRPFITVVPSMFSLFSLPLLIVGFSLGCQVSENSSIRYLLIAFYFLTFIPQMGTFLLYIYPSSFYRKEWQATNISQRITALKRHHSPKNSTTFSAVHAHNIEHRWQRTDHSKRVIN